MSQSDPYATQPPPAPQGFGPLPPSGVPQPTLAAPQPVPPVENPAAGFGAPPVPLDTSFFPPAAPQPTATFQPEQTMPLPAAPEAPAAAWATPSETVPNDNSGATFAAITPHEPTADITPPQAAIPMPQPWQTTPADQPWQAPDAATPQPVAPVAPADAQAAPLFPIYTGDAMPQPAAATPYPGQPYPPDQTYAPAQPPAPGQPPYAAAPGQDYTTQPGQPMPGQPYAPGYPPQMPPLKKKHTARNILIILLVLAVLGGGSGLAYWWFAGRDDPSKPVTAGQAKTPQAAVRGYLQALAAGNSSDALSFAASPPSDTTFLTDAMLTTSLASSPITNIVANKNDGSTKQSATVTASYQLGSQQVSATYNVNLNGKYYFIDQVTANVDLSTAYMDNIGMELNGVSLDDQTATTFPLFPGTYQLTIDNSMLVLTGGQFTITDPSSSPSFFDTKVALASDAQGRMADAVKTKLEGCVAEKTMTTSCGWGTPILITTDLEILTPITSSIKWFFFRGTSDFSATTFQYDQQDNATEANASVNVTLERDLDATNGKSYYSRVNITAVSVNFSNPDNLAVSFDWEYVRLS